jgi:hypothetical protein
LLFLIDLFFLYSLKEFTLEQNNKKNKYGMIINIPVKTTGFAPEGPVIKLTEYQK